MTTPISAVRFAIWPPNISPGSPPQAIRNEFLFGCRRILSPGILGQADAFRRARTGVRDRSLMAGEFGAQTALSRSRPSDLRKSRSWLRHAEGGELLTRRRAASPMAMRSVRIPLQAASGRTRGVPILNQSLAILPL